MSGMDQETFLTEPYSARKTIQKDFCNMRLHDEEVISILPPLLD